MRPSPITQAVLLAAGSGGRLGPLTADVPKCMVRVGAHCMLDLLLPNLAAAGVTSLIIVTGYKREVIEAHLAGLNSPIRIRTVYSPDYATTNNIVSLWRVRDAVPRDFWLLESDLIIPRQLLAEMGLGNCAAVSPLRAWMQGTVVTLTADGERLAGMYPGGEARPDLPLFKTVNVYGLALSSWTSTIWPALDARVRRGHTGIYYEAVLAEILQRREIAFRAHVVDPTTWFEIDTPEDLRQSINLLPDLR